ncbi:hypothetical protein H7H37_12725, partial [Mycolicibacterium insubricum]|nr:hypothetical protein [Mycolicibacterium insubricum]
TRRQTARRGGGERQATVEQATDPTPAPAALPAPATGRSPVPALVALALAVLAILLVRRLRRDDE